MGRVARKRGQGDRVTFSLMVHGPEFGAGEELVVNPEYFPQLKVGRWVGIRESPFTGSLSRSLCFLR